MYSKKREVEGAGTLLPYCENAGGPAGNSSRAEVCGAASADAMRLRHCAALSAGTSSFLSRPKQPRASIE